MTRVASVALALALVRLATVAWCYRLHLGLPSMASSVESPDGRHLAFVGSHPEIALRTLDLAAGTVGFSRPYP